MKEILTYITVLILVGIYFIPLTQTFDINNQKKFKKNDLSFNYEKNCFFDYGFKTGKKYNQQFKLVNILSNFLIKNKISNSKIKDHIDFLKENYPFFLDELKGLSKSLNTNLGRIVGLQINLNKFLSTEFQHQCTATISTGKATNNNMTYLTQNIDNGLNSFSKIITVVLLRFIILNPSIVRMNTLRYKYVYLGIPILWEFPLMNEMGLGFGGNGIPLTENKSRIIDEGSGISTAMLERLTMMTCKNVSEVAELWKSSERASGNNRAYPHHWDGSVSMWCDRDGGILSIEQTHSYIITVFGNSTEITGDPEDILYHANHHKWLSPNLTGSLLPDEYKSSVFRDKRAGELLIENYGNITLDVCKQITRDYKGGSNPYKHDSYDICRVPDKNQSSMTVFSWIINPQTFTLYFTRGPPHHYRFIKRDYSNIFEKEI